LNKQTQVSNDLKDWLSDFFKMLTNHFNSISNIKKIKEIEQKFYNNENDELFIHSYVFTDDAVDNYLYRLATYLGKDRIYKLTTFNYCRELLKYIKDSYEYINVQAMVDDETNCENAILFVILEKFDKDHSQQSGSEIFIISANPDIKVCTAYIKGYNAQKMNHGPETIFTDKIIKAFGS